MTIARVASRLSTNRSYQPLVLQGLKSFFDGKKRLIRQGDLLAVKVDLNQLQYLQASSTGDGSETSALGVSDGFAPLNSRFPEHVALRALQAGNLPIKRRANCVLHRDER